MSQNGLIIIVEDQEKIANILVEFFQLDGFETLVLPDGKNAVEKILDKAPTAVILDLMLLYTTQVYMTENQLKK